MTELKKDLIDVYGKEAMNKATLKAQDNYITLYFKRHDNTKILEQS